jgi:UDP-N-acetylmuramyl pentapeptide synthase
MLSKSIHIHPSPRYFSTVLCCVHPTTPGVHLAVNAAAAAAVAAALGLPLSDVCRDLRRYESLEMRMRVKEVPSRWGAVQVEFS